MRLIKPLLEFWGSRIKQNQRYILLISMHLPYLKNLTPALPMMQHDCQQFSQAVRQTGVLC